MSKRTANLIFLIFQIFIFVYYAWLRIDNADYIREPRSFGDTGDYLRNAEAPIFSREFWTDARPPLTALFWKLVNADPEKIFSLQLYFSIISWGVFGLAAAYVVRSYFIKPLVYIVALAFSLSRDIYMWDPFLGSESIALSLTVLFLASSIWLLLEWKWQKAVLMIFMGLLIVFTRDTSAYLLLMLAFIIVPIFWFSQYRWPAISIGIAFAIIFLISSQIAILGLRPFRAIIMNTALRIYPSEVYTEYFRAHGMPIDDKLVQEARNLQPGKKFVVYTALAFDEAQENYRQWALESGSSEYVKFLWFYKADTFQGVFLDTPGPSFFPDVYYYTATGYRPIIEDIRVAEILYPTRFGILFFFVANLFAIFVIPFAWRYQKVLWLTPLWMILLSYPQAVLVWAADVNDVARHSIIYNVLLRLGAWLLIFFIADFLLTDFSSKFKFSKRTNSSTEPASTLS